MMERAITVRELHAAVYPTDVEANGNGFWQRSLRALQDILPARIFVDEQEQQEIMNMSAIEKEKYLLWVPLQTILLEAWENEERGDVTCLGDYTANEYDGEDWFPVDFFAANTQLSYSNLKRRGVQQWPPMMIIANYLALQKKWGVVESMSSRFRSPFVFGCSVWEACHYLLSKAEPFKSDLKPLRSSLSEMQFAQIMGLHPWRPKPELPSPWHHYADWETTDLNFTRRLRLRGGVLEDLDDVEDEEPPQDLELAERMDPGETD